MAKKVYLVDSEGYNFFICEYDGLGADNKPRLTIMMPGKPVENFLAHLDCYGSNPEDYYLLCEEGQQADAATVVGMMAQICLKDMGIASRMAARMELMRKSGISYSREMQKLTMFIMERKDHETGDMTYCVKVYVGEQEHYVGESENYNSIGDIIEILKQLCWFVEGQMNIPLRKSLEVPASFKNSCKRYCPSVFDEIVGYQEK